MKTQDSHGFLHGLTRVRLICSGATGGQASATRSCTDSQSDGETLLDVLHRHFHRQNRGVGWMRRPAGVPGIR
jgi:hypothetical protein